MQEGVESREASDERLHGLVADRAAEDHRGHSRHAQRRDFQIPRQKMEDAVGGGSAALRPRGRKAQAFASARVSRLQIQAEEEGQAESV